jgi:hypothetical protein
MARLEKVEILMRWSIDTYVDKDKLYICNVVGLKD